MQQQRLIDNDDSWVVEHCGCRYTVNKDIRTDVNYVHPPSWYVQRMSDYKVSKRYYQRPGGAMNALASGSIVWVD